MIVSAVLRPGCQMYGHQLAIGQSCSASAGLTSPLATILLRIRSQSMPRPSSLTVITTLLPRCEAWSDDRPRARLAGGFAIVGRLQPVIDRVADHVDQRVAQLVDHPLVQLGLLAADLERHLLARGEAEVADHPPEPLEQRADRHHPGVEHPFLEPVGDPAQAVDRLGQRLELLAALAEAVQLVLDLAEVVAQPADMPGPAVERPRRPTPS